MIVYFLSSTNDCFDAVCHHFIKQYMYNVCMYVCMYVCLYVSDCQYVFVCVGDNQIITEDSKFGDNYDTQDCGR